MSFLLAKYSGWTQSLRRWRHPLPRRRRPPARRTPPSDSNWKVKSNAGRRKTEGESCWRPLFICSFLGFVQSTCRAAATGTAAGRRDAAKGPAGPPIGHRPAAVANGCGCLCRHSSGQDGDDQEARDADEAAEATSVCHAGQRQRERVPLSAEVIGSRLPGRLRLWGQLREAVAAQLDGEAAASRPPQRFWIPPLAHPGLGSRGPGRQGGDPQEGLALLSESHGQGAPARCGKGCASKEARNAPEEDSSPPAEALKDWIRTIQFENEWLFFSLSLFVNVHNRDVSVFPPLFFFLRLSSSLSSVLSGDTEIAYAEFFFVFS